MPRSSVPSLAQQEMLLEMLEEKRWLATGYARTSHARVRTRAAWREISLRLNTDGRGCIKSWQQWAKYWKDKKSATKKKYSLIRMAQQTGGDGADDIILTPIEERMISLMMDGNQIAMADKELKNDPSFHQSNNDSDSDPLSDALQGVEGALQVKIEEIRPGSDDDNAAVGYAEVQPDSFDVMNTSTIYSGNSLQAERRARTERAREAPASASVGASATSTPGRRRFRRVMQSSPPAQGQSRLASLTERFIAIEEQRVQTERMLAQNQSDFLAVFQKISEDFHELVQHIKNSQNPSSS